MHQQLREYPELMGAVLNDFGDHPHAGGSKNSADEGEGLLVQERRRLRQREHMESGLPGLKWVPFSDW